MHFGNKMLFNFGSDRDCIRCMLELRCSLFSKEVHQMQVGIKVFFIFGFFERSFIRYMSQNRSSLLSSHAKSCDFLPQGCFSAVNSKKCALHRASSLPGCVKNIAIALFFF